MVVAQQVQGFGDGMGASESTECGNRWHTLGTTGVHTSHPIGLSHGTELHKYWWARTVSNRRPLVCKTRALPLSYAPVPRQDTARTARCPKNAGNGSDLQL